MSFKSPAPRWFLDLRSEHSALSRGPDTTDGALEVRSPPASPLPPSPRFALATNEQGKIARLGNLPFHPNIFEPQIRHVTNIKVGR